jgi:ankyrin repeat protein
MDQDRLAAFIDAACVPLDSGHATGTLDRAESIRAAYPDVGRSSIHAAAILGDDATVRQFIQLDPQNAIAKGGPRNWDALTHLCFSRYLRLDRARSDGFVRAAAALLDAGASANTGWYETNHQPKPEWESALYGAAGIAHHPELTRLLLERGADPNDEETVYHTPETYDNRALKLIVETGKLTEESLSLMLIRKHDWHDYEGVKWLLEHGADPNHNRWRGFRAIHHAIARDNDLRIIELLFDHGADPMAVTQGLTAAARAARRGRGDVLESLERRRIPFELPGVERLIAACARNDATTVRSIIEHEPTLVTEVVQQGGKLLAEFSGNGNSGGVRHLLELGVDVDAPFAEGDGYWDVAPNSTALHVAAWRAQHATVRLLIERGAAVDARDGKGRTPLMQAIRACTDSYWKERRSPESVDALLRAGASVAGVKYPSGYGEVDEVLRRYGAGA